MKKPGKQAAKRIIFYVAVILTNAFSGSDTAFLNLKEPTSTPPGTFSLTHRHSNLNLIDNSINSDAYFVGGGDVFTINIVEFPSVEYTAIMDQNCDAEIPDLGIIRIGRKTLAEAKKIIADFITRRMKKQYQIYVTFSRAKSALVTVTGAIADPSTYQAEGTQRLLDVVLMSNKNTLPNVNEFNYREITVVNKDSSARYDLFQFMFRNDNAQNPYVYPGDTYFDSFSKQKGVYHGLRAKPVLGLIPIKPNERLRIFFPCLRWTARLIPTTLS